MPALLNVTPGIILISSAALRPVRVAESTSSLFKRGADFGRVYGNFGVRAGDNCDGGGLAADLQVDVGNRAAVALVQEDAVLFPASKAFCGDCDLVRAGDAGP